MATMAVCLFARRGLPQIHRQLLKRQEAFRCSAVFSIDDRRSVSQNVSPWVAWIYESPPVVFTDHALSTIHEASGLPWWATIAITTIAVRALTFPMVAYSDANLAKLANLEPEAKEYRDYLKEEVIAAKFKHRLSRKQAQKLYEWNFAQEKKLMVMRENCHPAKTFILSSMQFPIWCTLSFALRDITYEGGMGIFEFMTMSTEGLWWFPNLTKPDRTLILPLVTSMLHLTNVELYRLKGNLPTTKWAKVLRYGVWGLCVLTIPIGSVLPSAISLYWICSASSALAQTLLLMSPKVRRFLRIPITKFEDPTPYATVYKNFRTRILRHKV